MPGLDGAAAAVTQARSESQALRGQSYDLERQLAEAKHATESTQVRQASAPRALQAQSLSSDQNSLWQRVCCFVRAIAS